MSSRRGTWRMRSRSRGGEIVGQAGDPRLVTYFRSSAKPIQALPLVRARPDLEDAEIAIACASHLARPEQLEAVRSLLAKARRDGGRPRVRPRADEARAQLLREARRADRRSAALAAGRSRATGCPSTRASRRCSPRSPRQPRSIRSRCRPRPTAAASSRSRFRSSGWRTRSRGFRSSRAASRVVSAMQRLSGLHPRPARRGLGADEDAAGLGRERRRRGTALRRGTGRPRSSRSRSRTGRHGPCAPGSRRSSRCSGSTRESSATCRSSTRAARWSASSEPPETCPIRACRRWKRCQTPPFTLLRVAAAFGSISCSGAEIAVDARAVRSETRGSSGRAPNSCAGCGQGVRHQQCRNWTWPNRKVGLRCARLVG